MGSTTFRFKVTDLIVSGLIIPGLKIKRYLLAIFLCIGPILGSGLYAADVYIPKSQISEETEPNYYIISIGINNYLDDYWTTLKWPASDATRVADKLGGMTRINKTTRLIINESATLKNIKATLNDISQQARQNDIVILYISGHGTLSQTDSGELERVFLMHDSNQQDLLSTALPFSTLQAWLNGLQSRKNLMILATCHSGEGKSRLPESVKSLLSQRKGKLVTLSDVSEGALILTAAANGEAARENDKLQGDIYTYYLLEALSVYDRNKDGVISALEAHDYARDRTWVFTNGRQRPTANAKLIGDADIALQGTKNNDDKALPILEAYAEDMAGFFIKVDDNIKGRLPTAFPLNPNGSYVTLYSPKSDKPIARYKVNIGQGEKLNLRNVMYHRPIRVGSSILLSSWGHGWDKLTGNSNNTTTEITASYRYSHYGLGVLFNIPQEESNQIRDSIHASSKLRTSLLFGEYEYRRFGWSYSVRLELGREELSIELLDTSSGDTLSYKDTSTAIGLSSMATYTLRNDLSFSASFGIRDTTDWDFGNIGHVSGQHHWISIGINYQFGWVARTL